LLALPLLGLAAGLTACTADDTPDRHVVLLFTSDEHSHLVAFAPESDDHPAVMTPGTGAIVGGVLRRAALLRRERAAAAQAGKETLLVSTGDNQMGALPHLAFETVSVDYRMMKSLGYDVTNLGNHEFDFGPTALAHSLTAAAGERPPIVASNIHFSDLSPADDALAAHYSADVTDDRAIHPYRVVVTPGGVKVGVLGYVGVNAGSVAPNKTPVQFSAYAVAPAQEADPAVVLPELYQDLAPVVKTLREVEKVDLVVALGHAGMAAATLPVEQGEDYQVAAHVPGIDVLVSGHMHLEDPAPVVVKNLTGGGSTVVLDAGSFGRFVGRIELTVPGDGSAAYWDAGTQGLLPVTDALVPAEADVAALDEAIQSVESAGDGTTSHLEALLGRALGEAVHDDPAVSGDLYFYPIATTSFDVQDRDHVLALAADAMLSAADAWGAASGARTDMALESGGLLGAGVLMKGRTGVISAADAFGVVPLGRSPVDGTLGYPLIRAYVSQLELRAIFEATLQYGAVSDDFHFCQAGMRVEYDATRAPALTVSDLLDPAKGRVVRIRLDGDHGDGFEQFDQILYDVEAGLSSPLSLYAVVTSSYIGQFAASVGATLKDQAGNATTIAASILHRADGSEIKENEAFLGFLHGSPGGALSSIYDAASPQSTKRYVCVAGCP
jgi:2',3'-cyclic-nucleotide 2'-phosphodiesterase (5'-nucleotidase family)